MADRSERLENREMKLFTFQLSVFVPDEVESKEEAKDLVFRCIINSVNEAVESCKEEDFYDPELLLIAHDDFSVEISDNPDRP